MSKGGDGDVSFRVEVKNVPLFFGNMDEEIEVWFGVIERIALANEWKTESLAKLVPAYLRSKAAESWETLPVATQKEYGLMKEALISKLSQKGISNKYSTLLRNRKQGKDESATEYGRSIETLVRKAYPEMDLQGKEQVALDCFKSGLRPEIRRFAVTANPKSFDDAVAIASEQMCYASFETVEENRDQSFCVSAAQLNSNAIEDRMERLEKLLVQTVSKQNDTLESLGRQLRARSQTPPLRPALRNAAPEQRREFGDQNFNSQNRTRFTTSGVPICDFCGRRGHVKFNCRQRGFNNDSNFRNRSPAPFRRNASPNDRFRRPNRNFGPNPTPQRVRFQSESPRELEMRRGNGGVNYPASNSGNWRFQHLEASPRNPSDSTGLNSFDYGNYKHEVESLRSQNERLSERLLGQENRETTPKTSWSSSVPHRAFMMRFDDQKSNSGESQASHSPVYFSASEDAETSYMFDDSVAMSPSDIADKLNSDRDAKSIEETKPNQGEKKWLFQLWEEENNMKSTELLQQEQHRTSDQPFDLQHHEFTEVPFGASALSCLGRTYEIDDALHELDGSTDEHQAFENLQAIEDASTFISETDIQESEAHFPITCQKDWCTCVEHVRKLPPGKYRGIICGHQNNNRFFIHLPDDAMKVHGFSVLHQVGGFKEISDVSQDCYLGKYCWFTDRPFCWRAEIKQDMGEKVLACLVDYGSELHANKTDLIVNPKLDYLMEANPKYAIPCEVHEGPNLGHFIKDEFLTLPDPDGRFVNITVLGWDNGFHKVVINHVVQDNELTSVFPYKCLECTSTNIWPELSFRREAEGTPFQGFCINCNCFQYFRRVTDELGLAREPLQPLDWSSVVLRKTKSLAENNLHPKPHPVMGNSSSRASKDVMPFFGCDNILSNMYKAPIYIEGQVYSCNEQYYAYKKAMWIPDLVVANTIMTLSSPKEMKMLARDAFDVWLSQAERLAWRSDGKAIKILWDANWAKFNQYKHLKEALLETDDKIIAEATYDVYWGAGCPPNAKEMYEPHNWKGRNEMGKLLMRIRSAIRDVGKYKTEEAFFLDDLECNHLSSAKKMPLVIGRIDKKQPVEFLLDSGCNVSLIKLVILKRVPSFQNWLPVSKENRQSAKSITGESLELLGIVEVSLQLGQEDLMQKLHVVKDAPYDAVLGTDFMKLHNVKLDLGLGQMYVGNSALDLWPNEDEPVIKVHLDGSIILPPWSEIITHARLSKPASETGLIEGRSGISDIYEIAVANMLVSPRETHVPLRLANLNSDPVFLHDTLHIASYAPVARTVASDPCMAMHVDHTCTTTSIVEESNVSHVNKIDISNNDLSDTERKSLLRLLQENADIFSRGGYDVGHTSLVQHTINTGDNDPIKQRPYRLAESLREDVHRQLNEMEGKGIIRPSASPWCAPLVVVKKKTGENRLCVDYRKLNNISKADVYPLPRIDAILDKLGGATYFSSLDLASGYYQIEVADADKEKTAFSTGEDLFEFTVMPFGLKSAPATFQRLMCFVLAGIPSCFCYIDDILVTSSGNFENHLVELSKVFDRLRQGNLKLKPSKCSFGKRKVAFLGHEVSSEGIAPDPDKIRAIMEFPRPTDARTVKRFLGTCSYFRGFVEAFSIVGNPLFGLLRKNAPFIWTPACEEAFTGLKNRLAEHPILVYPDFSQPFRLHTDASDVGLGSILTQMRNSKDSAIAYASRTLVAAEKNYSVTEKEALAVVWSVGHFRHYLYGHYFVVITDHQALRWLMSIKNPVGRLARWSLSLQEYDFDIEYRPGKTNCADGLSRHPVDAIDTSATADCMTNKRAEIQAQGIPENSSLVELKQDEFKALLSASKARPEIDNNANASGITPEAHSELSEMDALHEKVRQRQRMDSAINAIIEFLENRNPVTDIEVLNQMREKVTAYVLKSGILYHVWSDNSKNRRSQTYLQMVVPTDMIPEIIECFHDDVFSGHLGFDRTYYKIRQRFFFDRMFDIIQEWCQTCVACKTRKPPTNYHREPLRPITAEGSFDIVVVDCLGPLPCTDSGNKYIVIFQDHFSKWPEAFATENIQALTVAKLFVEEIVCRHSAPRALLSDRGPCFISEVVKSICELLITRKIYSTAYRPTTQGLVERMNRTITEMLSQYVSTNQKDWDKSLNFVLFAYRTSLQESIQMEPFYLLYGRMPRFPIEAMLNPRYDVNTEPSQYIVDLRKRIVAVSKLARQNIEKSQTKQKLFHDKRVSRPFVPGDTVWLKRGQVPKNVNKKLTYKWSGLHRVQESYGDGNILLKALQGGKTQLVHSERCKLAKTSDMHIQDASTPLETINEEQTEDLLIIQDQIEPQNATSQASTHEQAIDAAKDDIMEQIDAEAAISAATPVEVSSPLTSPEEAPVITRGDGTSWRGRLRVRQNNLLLSNIGTLLLLLTTVFASMDGALNISAPQMQTKDTPGIKLNHRYGVLFQDMGLLDNAHDYVQQVIVIPYYLSIQRPIMPSICRTNITQNLKRTPFQEQLGIARNVNEMITDLCSLIDDVFRESTSSYNTMRQQIENFVDDFRSLNSSSARRRKKRNLIKGIICLFESVWGSCQSDGVDAKTLRAAIKTMHQQADRTSLEVNKVTKKLVAFAKLTMTGFRNIDGRFSDVRRANQAILHSQQKMARRFESLVGTLDRSVLAIKVQTSLLLQINQWNNIRIEWQAQQEAAYMTLRSLILMANGYLSSDLVAPHVLMELLEMHQEKLSNRGIRLAYPPKMIHHYYHLPLVSSVHIGFNRIVISAHIPISDHNSRYQLWKATFAQIAVPQSGFLRIDSRFDVLAVNPQTSQYILLSTEQLQTCGKGRFKNCLAVFPSIPSSTSSCLWTLWNQAPHTEVSHQCDVIIEHQRHPVSAFDIGKGRWFISNAPGDWRLFCARKAPISVSPCQHCVITLPCQCGLSTLAVNLPMRSHHCIHQNFTTYPEPNPFLIHNASVGSLKELSYHPHTSRFSPVFKYFQASFAPRYDLAVNFSKYIQWTEQGQQEFFSTDQQLSNNVASSIKKVKQVQSSSYWQFLGLLFGEIILLVIVLLLLFKDYLRGLLGLITPADPLPGISSGRYKVSYRTRRHNDSPLSQANPLPKPPRLVPDQSPTTTNLLPQPSSTPVASSLDDNQSPSVTVEYEEIKDDEPIPIYANWARQLQKHKSTK